MICYQYSCMFKCQLRFTPCYCAARCKICATTWPVFLNQGYTRVKTHIKRFKVDHRQVVWPLQHSQWLSTVGGQKGLKDWSSTFQVATQVKGTAFLHDRPIRLATLAEKRQQSQYALAYYFLGEWKQIFTKEYYTWLYQRVVRLYHCCFFTSGQGKY